MLHIHPQKNIWLIRNTKIDPVYKPVSLSLGDIDKKYMNALYQVGYEKGRSKSAWNIALKY